MTAMDGANAADHDGWVFQIIVSGTTSCLDLYGEDSTNGNAVKIWDCNGHESQLWFFDSGWFQIRWGGDMEKCLDAGDMQAGTQLMIWDCNGADQQLWGFDGDSGAIYSLNSEAQSDASLCMDLAGGTADAGNAVQVWDCNDEWNQQWTIQSGITIRPIENSGLCLDIPGGNVANGQTLWMWECNGQASQYWIFEGGTYQIKYAGDWNYCVDAQDMNGGSQLMLWECNGLDQQTWGYDGDLSTMFLAASADASLCMDLGGGSIENGAAIQTWSCNSCWNQEWQAWGPSSALQGVLKSTRASVTDDCPPLGPGPGPVPTPAPPTPSSGQFCWDEQSGWPSFGSMADLQNDQAWAGYFQLVYGEVPSSGYPICVGSFYILYASALSQAGVQTPSLGGRCPSSAGEMFKFGQSLFADGTDAGGMSYSGVGIWHPDMNRQALPGDTWVEITHAKTKEEVHGAWYYYMPGSGVWFYLGNTMDFQEHRDGAQQFMGSSSKCTSNECDNLSNSINQNACSSGVQSIQYLEHREADWHACQFVSGTTSLAIEIVDTCGAGKYSCGGSSWKAGWAASQDCSCDESRGAYNCQGFVPKW